MLDPLPQGGERIMSGQEEWRATVREWLLVGMAELGLSQSALAELSGISQAQISKYCIGRDAPGDEKLAQLARALRRQPPRVFVFAEVAEAGTPFADQTEQLLSIWRNMDARGRSALLHEAQRLRDRPSP